jgi:prolipoprotein diacylglyceryltransferase
MHTTGLILAIFGGVLLFASTLALACIKNNNKISTAEAFDLFILGGVIGFLCDLFRSIAEGLRNRSSPAFSSLILFGVSLTLLAVGGVLLMAS